MLRLLHLDASARPGHAGDQAHGSHSRQLSRAFVQRWLAARPGDTLVYRDLGAAPPTPVMHEWIPAAFAPPAQRTATHHATLVESDTLVRELQAADVLVVGMPMYNFGMPAPLKAWVDNVVRIGVTFGFDPSLDNPYQPLLADRPRRAVLLTSRGGTGFGAGGPLAAMNHADTALRDVLGFLGITTVETIAIEGEEAGGAALAASTDKALQAVADLVQVWAEPVEADNLATA